MKRFFITPNAVAVVETAALFRLMATGESDMKDFLDKKNQILFDNLSHLQEQIGQVGTQQLISYLNEQNLIEDAGGESYVKKIFCGLEPAEVYA